MTITLSLKPEQQARLEKQAQAQGKSVEEYLQGVLKDLLQTPEEALQEVLAALNDQSRFDLWAQEEDSELGELRRQGAEGRLKAYKILMDQASEAGDQDATYTNGWLIFSEHFVLGNRMAAFEMLEELKAISYPDPIGKAQISLYIARQLLQGKELEAALEFALIGQKSIEVSPFQLYSVPYYLGLKKVELAVRTAIDPKQAEIHGILFKLSSFAGGVNMSDEVFLEALTTLVDRGVARQDYRNIVDLAWADAMRRNKFYRQLTPAVATDLEAVRARMKKRVYRRRKET